MQQQAFALPLGWGVLDLKTFSVPGKAVPKGRHRSRVVNSGGGNRVVSYTPMATVNFEALVKMAAREAELPYIEDGPVAIHVVDLRGFPKSMSKKKRRSSLPVTKPDLDNVVKSVKDALNGVAYRDDSQVVLELAVKSYTEGEPSTMVSVGRVHHQGRMIS